MTKYGLAYVAILSLVMGACGSSDDPAGGADAGNNPSVDAGNNNGADAAAGDWQTLISGNWTMPAFQEGYVCVRLTVQEDMYINQFEAINPLGTHHTVLTVGDSTQPDDTFPCNAGTNDDAMIFGSGVGTDPVNLPAGVAMHIKAGQKLLLNLHLFNSSDTEITGTSGTRIKTIPQAQVQHVAEAILAGPTVSLNVPPGISTQSGGCYMNGDVTIFAVGPHMHQYGIEMTVNADSSVEGSKMLLNELYSFYEQRLYQIDPIEMKSGDLVSVDCKYNNTSGSNVPFGDSSEQEMCFATLYRYPAFGGNFGIVCDRGF